MELLFIVVSLVLQIDSTEGTCRCLDQTLCEDPASGCNYRCQPGFTGKKCQHDNLGYMSSRNAKELFDGDYSTCLKIPSLTKINFSQPIDVGTIRVHRENKGTGKFYAYVYINTKSVETFRSLRNYVFKTDGPAAAATFPVQTGVTSVRIDSLNKACEVELTNDNECSTGFYGSRCNQKCATGCGDGDCNHVNGSCVCKAGWMGDKCSEDCAESGRYGRDCRYECSEGCNSGTCDRVSGRCNCKPGWTGDSCSGKCEPGSYGPQCQETCGPNCRTCHHVNGSCGHDCKSGWFGENCDKRILKTGCQNIMMMLS